MSNLNNVINKSDLMEKLKNAEREVKVLSVLAFDIDWIALREGWFNKINAGDLRVEIILESEEEAYKRSIIASNRRFSGEERSYELGSFLNRFPRKLNLGFKINNTTNQI